jgi:hypothetical protein
MRRIRYTDAPPLEPQGLSKTGAGDLLPQKAIGIRDTVCRTIVPEEIEARYASSPQSRAS